MKKQVENINRGLDAAEVQRLRDEIGKRLSYVPPSVLNGSYQIAVDWKKAAYEANKVAGLKVVTIKKPQSALGSLAPFYGESHQREIFQ